MLEFIKLLNQSTKTMCLQKIPKIRAKQHKHKQKQKTDDDSLFKSIQAGINFDRYDKTPVEISSNNPTAPINPFVEPRPLSAVSSNVKIASEFKLTPIQKHALPVIVSGWDLMSCCQTGAGKTAAFLSPVLAGMINKGLE